MRSYSLFKCDCINVIALARTVDDQRAEKPQELQKGRWSVCRTEWNQTIQQFFGADKMIEGGGIAG